MKKFNLNNKGFTIVELMAIVVILTLLALIATPNIIQYMNDGKDKYIEHLKNQLVLSSKNYYSENTIRLPDEKGSFDIITVKEMQTGGYVSKSFVDDKGNDCSNSLVKVTNNGDEQSKYSYVGCLICDNRSFGDEDSCDSRYVVSFNVVNGTVDKTIEKVNPGDSAKAVFKPNDSNAFPSVECSSNNYNMDDNTLTVNNVQSNMTCTVTYKIDTPTTVLYDDGTLIINELLSSRENNIKKHREVVEEYYAMSKSNSYSFSSESSQPWKSERKKIKHIEIGQEISPTSTAYWFAKLNNLSTGNFEKLDTSKTNDMHYMFYGAGNDSQLFDIGDLSNWDVSNVTNMSFMFGDNSNRNVNKIETWNIGDLSNWDTSKVTNMAGMFYTAGKNANKFNIGELSNWNVSNVKDMYWMFSHAGNKAEEFNIGNLSAWDTSQVTDMSGMFNNAGAKATTWNIGDLSKWDTSKVTTMYSMFCYASYSTDTFYVGNLSAWDTSQVTDMSGMFNNAGANATTWNIGDLSNWDTSKVTNMSGMFNNAGAKATTWKIGDLSNWDTSQVTNMSFMFCLAGINAKTFVLDLSKWNTSNVEDMHYMFQTTGEKATTFSIGNISNWDTSKVTNMAGMFEYMARKASNFTLDLSKWDFSKVANMNLMFTSCGTSATTWKVTIPKKTGSLTNTTSKLYGNSSSVYSGPSSGRSFTIAS